MVSNRNAPAISRDTWFALGLLTLLVLAYWPALNGSYLWDDDAHVTRTGLRSLDGLRQIWFHLGATQQYYPLLHSAFWLEARLWGDTYLGYHLANLLQHFANAILIVLLCRRLEIKGAWIAAFLFALHPVQVETVAWISEQKNTLSLLFYLLSALAYLRFDEERSIRNYALALALFVCALLTKTITATLPATLLVIFWWKRGRIDWRRDVVPLLPWFVLAAAGGLFTAWVEHNIIGAEGAEFSLGMVQRLLLAPRIVVFYIGKIGLRGHFVFSYPHWDVRTSDVVAYMYPLIVAGILGALWTLRAQTRAPLAAFLIFAGSLFPVLGFFNVYPFRYSYVADHFLYLPSLALIIPAAAWLQSRLERRVVPAERRIVQAVVGLLVTGFALMSCVLSLDYTDAETSYRAVIAENPDSWMAHNNLGRILSRGQTRMPEAITHFEAVLRLKPDHARAHYSLGVDEFLTGRAADAVPHFQRVLELEPNNPLLVTNSKWFLAKIASGDTSKTKP